MDDIIGKYPAIVVENSFSGQGSPVKGAIKVVCPELLGYKTTMIDGLPFKQLLDLMVVSQWVKPKWQHSMDFYTPEIGEGVYIEALRGRSLSNLIWDGCFPGEDYINEFDALPKEGINTQVTEVTDRIFGCRNGSYIKMEDKPDGTIVIEVFGKNKANPTRKGCTIILDGTTGSENIIIQSQDKLGMKKNTVTVGPDKVELLDSNKNTLLMDSAGVDVTDKNSNSIAMTSSGNTIKDKAGNEIKMTSTGIVAKDVAGNEVILDMTGITLKTGDAAIWKPNILPQCVFSQAPHCTIVKLKGM